ncbi:MAG: phenylalanine--tRNA ligase subunit beta [Treponema sp.]|nr:phenylalanine--tRNA ligase subunit beta [Treponema sp.]
MPKIEVNEKLFFNLVGKNYDYDTLEKKLTVGKAELDEKPDMTKSEDERVIKIELNDTNRPDLWSTGGVARCLREYEGRPSANYESFMSTKDKTVDTGDRVVTVDPELKNIRPYMVSFVISGKPIDDGMLKDIIQTQEKLAWNFGRKRKTISMGVYREKELKWPVHYLAVDPDTTSFIPLTFDKPLTCRQILTEHPKGKDYGYILQDKAKFPLLKDDNGEIMSMAPIINSASLGAVQVGDTDLLVELTGTEMESLILSANIVACDFADAGYKILPVKVVHPYETGFGKEVVAPYYFQKTTSAHLSAINKKLGATLTKEQVIEALKRMGSKVEVKDNGNDTEFIVSPAPYRNDFLHEVDVIEDVMIGQGLDFFTPEAPKDFTIGRLLPVTLYSRKAKTIMVGLGYQEMVFNYLGSKKHYIDNMNIDGKDVIEIANPMSENYQFIRPSIIASLLEAESLSGNAVYPHKIFEIGKIAYIAPEEVTGTKTVQSLGFMTASTNANFNQAASEVSSLLYYLDHKYEVKETNDPRFIPGRQAGIIANGKQIGIFGEVHPAVLANWEITVPCVAGEIDVEELMANESKEAIKAPKKEEPKKAETKASNKEEGPKLAEDQIAHFNKYVELKVAKILSVECNPQGDRLYIEHLDDGSGTERVIQSGLRPYLKEEELLGQHVIIAANLAPRKMKGVESHGMLLAADYKDENGNEKVELLTAPWAEPGTAVVPKGTDPSLTKPETIKIDKLEKIYLEIKDKHFQLAGVDMTAADKEITTEKTINSAVE